MTADVSKGATNTLEGIVAWHEDGQVSLRVDVVVDGSVDNGSTRGREVEAGSAVQEA